MAMTAKRVDVLPLADTANVETLGKAKLAKLRRVLHLNAASETSCQDAAQSQITVVADCDDELIDTEAFHEHIQPGDRSEEGAVDRKMELVVLVGIPDDLIAVLLQRASRILSRRVGADDDHPSSR